MRLIFVRAGFYVFFLLYAEINHKGCASSYITHISQQANALYGLVVISKLLQHGLAADRALEFELKRLPQARRVEDMSVVAIERRNLLA